MRDCNKDRRVTLPKRVTSLTWGPPPPCTTDLKRLPAFAKWLSKLKKFPQLFCIVQEGKTFEESAAPSSYDATRHNGNS